jgi:hypothetical protein
VPSVPPRPSRRWPWHLAAAAVLASGIATATLLVRTGVEKRPLPAPPAPPAVVPPTASRAVEEPAPQKPASEPVAAQVVTPDRPRRPVKSHPVRPSTVVETQPVPVKKSKADDKIADSPYHLAPTTSPKAP